MTPKPRPPTTVRIDTKEGRAALAPRKEPYWRRIGPGRAVGFRALELGGRGSWWARYRAPLGRQMYEGLDARDYRGAVELAIEWFARIERGQVVLGGEAVGASSTPSIEYVARAYVARKRASDKAKDRACGAHAHTLFSRYLYGGATVNGALVEPHPLASFSIRSSDRAIDELGLQLGAWRSGLLEHMAPQSAERRWISLKAAINAAIKSREIRLSREIGRAWSDLEPLQADDETSTDTAYLEPHERERLLEACEPPLAALLHLIELTGARPGKETNPLLVSDFDPFNRTLRVRDGKTGRRRVPLTRAAIAHLRSAASGKAPNQLLFPRSNGKAWTCGRVAEAFARALAASGIEKPGERIVPYSFRHSFITDAIRERVDAMTVARICGTSPEMIRKSYFHLLQDQASEQLERIQARVLEGRRRAGA
jgi:integrase